MCCMLCERLYEFLLDGFVGVFGVSGSDAWAVGWAIWCDLAGLASDALHLLGA
mgnify:FL=1